ncbi:unnamed protein product, partial [Adineta ricciae]
MSSSGPLFYNYIMSWCSYIILPPLLLYAIMQILYWLSHRTNFFGRYYAMLYYTLQERFDITLVLRELKNPTDKNKTFADIVNHYDFFAYWLMCLDKPRVNAYEEAIKQYAQLRKKAVWLDIGTGAHMPLTRLLIKYGVAEHVHAVDANRKTYQSAKTLREHLPNGEKQRI